MNLKQHNFKMKWRQIRPCHRIPRQYRSLVLIVCIILVLLPLVLPIYMVYKNERKTSPSNTFSINSNTPDRVDVHLNAISVDVITQSLKIKVLFEAIGSFRTIDARRYPLTSLRLPSDVSDSQTKSGISFFIGQANNVTFINGDVLTSTIIELPFSGGDLNTFPFDTYTASLAVSAEYTFTDNPRPPLGIKAEFPVSGFNIKATWQELDKSKVILLTLDIHRSNTTIIFSSFLFLLLWFLSFTAFGLALDIIMRKRELNPPLLSMFMGLIFALPALRNAIPGAPVVGADIDILGFFWNMVLAGVSALIMLWYYVITFKDNKMLEVQRERTPSPSRMYLVNQEKMKKSEALNVDNTLVLNSKEMINGIRQSSSSFESLIVPNVGH